MEKNYSKQALMEFFDYLSSKGLMNSNTVSARKAAANKMLSVLEGTEIQDLRNINLESVFVRFFNLHGKDFSPESMAAYKSRLKNSIEDFVRYTNDPAAFRPEGQRVRLVQKQPNELEVYRMPSKSAAPFSSVDQNSFPIPIRPDVIVRLMGIPSDLTLKEAQKIANVVIALANVAED